MEHRQVWEYISDAAVDAPSENSLYKCHSISDALRMIREWSLPLYPAERHLLVAELERVQFMGDEESEIVQFILRQFPERPSHPHALVVGCGCRDEGGVEVGVQRRDNNMVSRGVGMPRQQQQPQQYWSRGGGMPQQQQQQQLQYWSRDGGIPHQHQRRSHAFPPARQTRQPQPLQLPPRRIHTSGGDGEHGRNPLSPPATEAVPDTSVFLAASSKAVAEAPTSSAGAASTAVPAGAPATGGTVFPTTLVGGAARAPAPADETAVSKAASTASGTVPSATPLREAVGARESSAGAASSDAVSKAAPATSGTVTSATPLTGAVGRVSRHLERRHPTWQRGRFHWRSATTTTAATAVTTSSAAVTAETTAVAAAATTPPAITTHGGKQPMLEHCCDPSILGKDANGMRG